MAPVSPFVPNAETPVSTPLIYQFPFLIVTSELVPSTPSLPFVTVNCVFVPSVNVIVYVSTKPTVFVFVILEIPLPVSPLTPSADLPESTPSINHFPSCIVITGVCPSSPFSP